MINAYIYSIKSGVFLEEKSGSKDIITKGLFPNTYYTTKAPPNYKQTWRWVDTEWVELLPINNPAIPYGDEYEWDNIQNQWVVCPELDAYKYLEQQDELWELIKERRLQAVTSGVYVESVDKWFHTDTVSVTSYSTIAGMIALNNYEPVQWKVMDNTWLLLTEPLFKELQTAMSQKTNAIYAVAEQHKAAMLLADNPLEYDFSDGWSEVNVNY